MVSLALCRQALARVAWLRGFGLLLALAVATAGPPRWEVHEHAAAEHGHTHAGLLVQHDAPQPLVGEDSGAVLPHLHDAASLFAALPLVETLRVDGSLPDVWILNFQRAPVATAAGPPPHRPPIV